MDTFISLLMEKGFEKITIKDIADRANINRGTVYLHYVDKFDLLDKCIEIHVEKLIRHCEDPKDRDLNPGAFQSVFAYIEKHFSLYRLLLGQEGMGFFRRRLYAIVSQTVSDLLSAQQENAAVSNEVTIHFLTCGFIGILEWWIHHSMPCSVQEITRQLMLMLEPYARYFVPHA